MLLDPATRMETAHALAAKGRWESESGSRRLLRLRNAPKDSPIARAILRIEPPMKAPRKVFEPLAIGAPRP